VLWGRRPSVLNTKIQKNCRLHNYDYPNAKAVLRTSLSHQWARPVVVSERLVIRVHVEVRLVAKIPCIVINTLQENEQNVLYFAQCKQNIYVLYCEFVMCFIMLICCFTLCSQLLLECHHNINTVHYYIYVGVPTGLWDVCHCHENADQVCILWIQQLQFFMLNSL